MKEFWQQLLKYRNCHKTGKKIKLKAIRKRMRQLGLNDALNITFTQAVNRFNEAKKEFNAAKQTEAAQPNRYKLLKHLDEIKAKKLGVEVGKFTKQHYQVEKITGQRPAAKEDYTGL